MKQTTSPGLDERVDRLIAAEYPMYEPSKTDRLERLALLVAVRDAADAAIAHDVAGLRSAGVRKQVWNPRTYGYNSDRYGWEEIGKALGLPKSTAQRKYRDHAPAERSR